MSRTPDEEILLRHVPNDGTTIGNLRLKKFLGWNIDRYLQTRDKLVEKGILSIGRGKGGSVYRLTPEKPTKKPRYAAQTTVPVSQSRGEIDTLLRNWCCRGIQWTDNFENGMVILRFAWPFEKNTYMARFVMQTQQGQQEHRVLLLWLKAAFNAVEIGIIKPEEVFLPFIENKEGRTVGELIVKQLPAFICMDHSRLLERSES